MYVSSLGISTDTSSVNRHNCASFCPIWMTFPSFSCLLALSRISSIMPNRRRKSGHHHPVPDLRGKTCNLLLLSMLLAIGFYYMGFIMLRKFLPIPSLSVFYHKRCWTLSSGFSVLIQMIMWSFFFILLMWCITLIFLLLNHLVPLE